MLFRSADQLNTNFKGAISSQIKSYISELIIREKIPIFELSAHLESISQALPEKLNQTLAEYGLEIVRFNLMSISVSEDDPSVKQLKEMLTQKAQLTVLGSNYQQVRSFDVLEGAANNNGTAGAFLGVGVGAAFNNTMFGGAPIMNTYPPTAVASQPADEDRKSVV